MTCCGERLSEGKSFIWGFEECLQIGGNKNARLCTFRCVAWQRARLTGNLDRGGVFLRPRVNLGQRQRSRGRSVSGLNFTTNRGTFKMYNSPRDHWSNRYFETLALQRSSAEFRRCNTSIRACMSLCVCVYICSATLTLRAADVMISETNHQVPGKLSMGDQQEKAFFFLPMTHNKRTRH